MDFNGFQWISTDFNGFPMISEDFNMISEDFQVIHNVYSDGTEVGISLVVFYI